MTGTLADAGPPLIALPPAQVSAAVAALATSHRLEPEIVFGAVVATLVYRLTGQKSVTVVIGEIKNDGRCVQIRPTPETRLNDIVDQLRTGTDAWIEEDATNVDVLVVGVGRCRIPALAGVPAGLVTERLWTLLDAVARFAHRPIRLLPVVGPAERRRILGFNPAPGPVPTVPVPEMICRQAARTPDRTAVCDDSRRVTYREFMDEAALVAGRLRAAGIGPGSVVGLCAERGVDLVVAVLGILLAGAAYLPLDPVHPRARRELMLRTARAGALLTTSPVASPTLDHTAVAEPDGPPVYDLRVVPANGLASGAPVDWRAFRAADEVVDGLAYVIFTSGSTGQPKGVEMTHRSLANRLGWMQDEYRLTVADAVLQKTPYTFDVSVWELLWPLMYGARLVMAAPGVHRDPQALVELIRHERITIVHFVPSMLALFVTEPGFETCTSLRTVICSGEALPPKTVNRLTAGLAAEVHNLYGPTEAAIDVTAWPCRRPEPPSGVPIGRPISNVAVYVLDDAGDLAPIGVTGELYLGGACLARGYASAPELTAERFVTIDVAGRPERVYRTGDLVWWAEDGHINYVGRTDDQVKIRGQRVELGEIEKVLQTHPLIQNAVVTVRGPARTVLVAYIVPEPGAMVDDRSLRGFLGDRLPDYMVPSRYVPLDELPTSVNGKVDRTALPEPPRRGRAGQTALSAQGGGPSNLSACTSNTMAASTPSS